MNHTKLKHPRAIDLKQACILVLLILCAGFFLIPFYFITVNSFKTFGEIVLDPAALPASLQWKNYTLAMKQVNFPKVFLNSIMVSVCGVSGMVVLGSLAAWKLARVSHWVGSIMFTCYVAAMVIPFQSVMIPLVKVSASLNLIDSIPGLVLIYLGFGQPFTVFLYHGFVKGVPLELEESARLDGCADVRLFVAIVFPLLKTITITVIILQTLWVWNDFLLPSLILYKRDLHTIPLGINRFFGQYKNQWDKALPTLVLSMLPIVIFFLTLQKHMIKGISDGALKG
jgi:raffinose/stachyose/melibiose transport system permease protein